MSKYTVINCTTCKSSPESDDLRLLKVSDKSELLFISSMHTDKGTKRTEIVISPEDAINLANDILANVMLD